MKRLQRRLSVSVLSAMVAGVVAPIALATPAFAATQTITVTSTAPASRPVGGVTYTPTATASSGLPVSVGVTVASLGVCENNGGVISFIGTGTCTVRFTQAGNATYDPAPAVNDQPITVFQGTQVINFTTTPPSSPTVGGATYSVNAVSTAGTTVDLTSDTGTVCDFLNNTTIVAFYGAGQCVLRASNAGSPTTYGSASQTQSFTVGKGVQTLQFTTNPGSGVVGGAQYTPNVVSSAGLVPTLSIAPASASVCSIAGGNVSFNSAGQCKIDATQVGSADYTAASASQTLTVTTGAAPQSITFTSTPVSPVSGMNPGQTPKTYTPTAVSSVPANSAGIVFSAAPAGVCTASAGVISYVGVGTCTITASHPGNGTNAPAAATQNVQVVITAQHIVLDPLTTPRAPGNSATASAITYEGTTGTVNGSPLPPVYGTSTPSVCTVNATTGEVFYQFAGTCSVTASQPGNALYSAAPVVTQGVVVTAGNTAQSITTFNPSAPSAVAGGPNYTILDANAVASSGLTVLVSSNSPSVCTVSGIAGRLVKFLSVGSCSLTATQPGNATYAAASPATTVINVGQGTQTLAVTSTPPTTAAVGSTYNVVGTITTSGGFTDLLTPTVSAAGACSASGLTVTFGGASGTCTVTVSAPATASYTAGVPITQSPTTVNGPITPPAKLAQTITVTSTAPANVQPGGPTYTPTATGGASGNPVVITIAPVSDTVCAINGGIVSFTAAGTCHVLFNQVGNATYDPAPQQFQSITVGAGQTIAFTSAAPTAAGVGGPTYTPTASGGASGQPVVIALDATSTGCTLTAGVVSFTALGTCVLKANQAAGNGLPAAAEVKQSFAVGKGTQTIVFTSTAPANATPGTATYTPTATGGASGNPVTFALDPASTGCVATSATTVTLSNAGTCIIVASQAGNALYNAATAVKQQFAISKFTQTVTFTSAAPTSAKADGPAYKPTATGGASGQPIVFGTSTPTVCSLSTGFVVFKAQGVCTVTASQAGNATYDAATTATQSFNVGAADVEPEPTENARPLLQQISKNGKVLLGVFVEPEYEGLTVIFFVRSGLTGKVRPLGTAIVDNKGQAFRLLTLKKGQHLAVYSKLLGADNIVTPYSNDVQFVVK